VIHQGAVKTLLATRKNSSLTEIVDLLTTQSKIVNPKSKIQNPYSRTGVSFVKVLYIPTFSMHPWYDDFMAAVDGRYPVEL